MKMKTIQRAFALALTLVMVLSAAPLGVFAEGEDTCTCTTKCVETANAECPVCAGDLAACAGTAQEEPETKETPTPPKAGNQTPENKVEKKTEETPGNTGNPPAAGGDDKTNPQKKETPSPVGSGKDGLTKTQPFTVTFNANGGEPAPAPMTTKEDGTLNGTLPEPTKTGHTFAGWFVDSECTGTAVGAAHTYTADTTLYAKWTENPATGTESENKPATGITVTFNFQLDGVANERRTAKADGTLDDPLPTHSKTDYNLLGWYLTTDYTGAVTKETKFDKDTMVYAKWEEQPQAVTVTFNANDGECGVTSATVNENKKLDSLPTPTWAGHEFLGWYTQDTNTKVSLDKTYDKPTTLVAQWKKEVSVVKPNNVTLGEDFLKENSEKLKPGTEKVEIRVEEVKDETHLDLIKSELGGKLDDKELLAVYDLSVYMIIDSEHQPLTPVTGLIQFDFPVTGNVAAVYHDTDPMPQYDDSGTNPGYRQTGSTLTIWANSFSPYAIAIDGYRITLDARGGTLATGVSNPMLTDPEGILKNLPEPPTKTGYTFVGWYRNEKCDGEEVKAGAKFESNATIYAKWEPITYKVVFHDNYRKPEEEKTSEQTLTYDQEERLSYDETKIKRDYYQLDGWAVTSDGEIVYGTNNPVKNLCSQQGAEKHLYAVWSYQRKTVNFDACGGKIKENGQEVGSVTKQTQESPINTVNAKDIPVPELREGYYFGGWYTQEDGKGDLVKPGETVFKDRTTVYAYWVEFEPVTVTFNCWGGTARIGSTDVKEFTMQTKWPGVLDGTPTTPSRSSYKFEGWYTAAGVKVDENTLFLRNSTVYAHWKRAVSITGNPRTGDQVQLEAAIAILAAAAIGLGATVILKKRKDK